MGGNLGPLTQGVHQTTLDSTMVDFIDKKRSALTELCQQNRVLRLYLFGSATGPRFDPVQSDLDFLVSFVNRQPAGDYADRFLDLAEGLEHLFGRSVDLVTEQSIRNPYLRNEIESTRQLLYEKPDTETAV